MIVVEDESQHGVWFRSRQLWTQNEDTADLPDKVDRRPFTNW